MKGKNPRVSSTFEERPKSPFGWHQYARIIELPDLSTESLEAAAVHIREGLNTVLDHAASRSGTSFPIIVRAAGAELCERTYWRLLAEVSDRATDLVCEYIGTVQSLGSVYYNEDDATFGANALFGTLDVLVIDRPGREFNADVALLDAFITFIGASDDLSDLDHEIHQHRYIMEVLGRTRSSHPDHYLRLLYERLFFGQHGVSEFTSDELNKLIGATAISGQANLKGLFDVIRDRHLVLPVSEAGDSLLPLVAGIYGSDDAASEAVYAYLGLDFTELRTIRTALDRWRLDLEHQIQVANMRLKRRLPSQLSVLTTGFHDYDVDARAWVKRGDW